MGYFTSVPGRVVCICLLLLFAPRAFAQGSLTPPAGAPAPVYKTLTQMEPRTAVNTLTGDANAKHIISKPGSYYLTGSITGTANMSGISITTEGVTLDLNGFELIGVPQSQYGIIVNASKTAIWNGIVRNWGSSGIFGSKMCSLDKITAFRNKGAGISLSEGGHVINSFVHHNGIAGAFIGAGTIMEDCRATSNTGTGISIEGDGGQIRNCTVQYNSGTGIGQSSGSSWLIENNTVTDNDSYGLNMASRNTIRGNIISYNAQGAVGAIAGINLRLGGNRVEDNQLYSNHYGIYANNNPGKEIVIRNTVAGSEVSNYAGNGGNNASTFGPISMTVVGVTNPTTNFSF